MSIQEQISRINDAKNDIVDSIESKGVSVPDGTKIDALATYVDAIPTAADIPAAGTELGTVKSGGDVTISSGIITVNDDSHNHVISNVDGLQTALDRKVTLDTAQEITGKKTLTSNFLVKVATNDALAPAGDWGWASPISKYLWHDLLAFREAKAEYSTNGSTWTEDTSDSFKCNLTNQKENQSINVITDSRPHARFTWDGGSAIWHACQAAWLIIGFTYVASAATCTIKFQSSTDGSTFTDVFTKSMAGNQAPYWLKLNESLWSQCRAVRLTISRTSTSGSLALSSVRWLTKRWGNQGFGSELETPFEWNNDASITRRKSKSTLGTSSAPWAAVYGTTLYEGGVALSSKYATPTFVDGKFETLEDAIPTKTSQLTNDSGFATETYVNNKVAGIVDSSPEALNTLNELAAALGDDPNFATTVATQIGGKADQADVDQLHQMYNDTYDELAKKANASSLSKVATSGSYNDLDDKPNIPSAVTVDSALSSTSTNPVQNKVIKTALDGKQASGSYVIRNGTGVQSITGGLVVGGTSATATGVGRIMVTGSTNPLIGLQAINASGTQLTPYYFQVSNDVMYIGPTSSKALAFDSNGNTSVPAALTVSGEITENGSKLSSKYVTNTKLEEVLGSYVNDIDALLGG